MLEWFSGSAYHVFFCFCKDLSFETFIIVFFSFCVLIATLLSSASPCLICADGELFCSKKIKENQLKVCCSSFLFITCSPTDFTETMTDEESQSWTRRSRPCLSFKCPVQFMINSALCMQPTA